MNNLEWLELVKKKDKERKNEIPIYGSIDEDEITYRKAKALEIIAEEFCKYNISLSKFSKELDEANKLVEECNKGGKNG